MSVTDVMIGLTLALFLMAGITLFLIVLMAFLDDMEERRYRKAMRR